ncbi:MAG TPA: tail fiber protein [Rhizomicrobium sp.]|jgi:microcystin-dependent protein|nr:tail fiber protein [Rhizomicrobium sp.]
MSNQYVGEIRPFGFTFAPRDWAFCDGALQSIANNSTLFAVIGTTYGGDGQTTFGLPDMRGRAPMHQGTGPGLTPRVIGQSFGSANVTLLQANMPAHIHTINALANAQGGEALETGTPGPTAMLGNSTSGCKGWHGTTTVPPLQPFSNKAISINGGSLPHDNLQPLLAVNFCMALFGIFPTRN